MKSIFKVLLCVCALSVGGAAYADVGVVLKKFGACDYFIVDGPRGLYVLEWYGGHDPDEGEKIVGDIGSYGFADVYYPDQDDEGRVWVEDYLESITSAVEEISDHCD
jgi:hypothetical protein